MSLSPSSGARNYGSRIFTGFFASFFNKSLFPPRRHFLPILGTGIVTSEGSEWRRQRAVVQVGRGISFSLGIGALSSINPTLSQHSLRSVALERVGGIAWRAAGRLLERLGRYEGTGLAVDMAEEVRQCAPRPGSGSRD